MLFTAQKILCATSICLLESLIGVAELYPKLSHAYLPIVTFERKFKIVTEFCCDVTLSKFIATKPGVSLISRCKVTMTNEIDLFVVVRRQVFVGLAAS